MGSAENFWKFLSSMIITLKLGVRGCRRAEACVLVRLQTKLPNKRYVLTQANILKFSQTHAHLPINVIHTCTCARAHTRTSQTRISQPSSGPNQSVKLSSGPNPSVKFDQTKVPSMTNAACLQKMRGLSPQGEGHWGYSSSESVAASACDLCQISENIQNAEKVSPVLEKRRPMSPSAACTRPKVRTKELQCPKQPRLQKFLFCDEPHPSTAPSLKKKKRNRKRKENKNSAEKNNNWPLNVKLLFALA